MSELKQRISDDVKSAMRNKERELLGVLRLISAAIKQIEVDQRIDLDDQQIIAVLDKLAKQHRDSIEQYEKAGRQDLADKEHFELGIVQGYLPAALSEAEITQLISDAIAETGASSIKDMGKIMGILKSRAQGRADMGKLSGQVRTMLGKPGMTA